MGYKPCGIKGERMKIKMWIDLPNDTIMDPKHTYATGDVLSQKMIGWSRYLIEVDLPVHHFKPAEDRKIEVITIGKEEE